MAVGGCPVISSYCRPDNTTRQDWENQAIEALNAIGAEGEWLMGGDFNDVPEESDMVATLAACSATHYAPPWPTRVNGRRTIDYFVAKGTLDVKRIWDPHWTIRDHYAVGIDIELPYARAESSWRLLRTSNLTNKPGGDCEWERTWMEEWRKRKGRLHRRLEEQGNPSRWSQEHVDGLWDLWTRTLEDVADIATRERIRTQPDDEYWQTRANAGRERRKGIPKLVEEKKPRRLPAGHATSFNMRRKRNAVAWMRAYYRTQLSQERKNIQRKLTRAGWPPGSFNPSTHEELMKKINKEAHEEGLARLRA